jgi:hypothetical protein
MVIGKSKIVSLGLVVAALACAMFGQRQAITAGPKGPENATPKETTSRWEYKVLLRDSARLASIEGLAPKASPDKLTDGLNKLGQEGWELVAIESSPITFIAGIPNTEPPNYVFRRRK